MAGMSLAFVLPHPCGRLLQALNLIQGDFYHVYMVSPSPFPFSLGKGLGLGDLHVVPLKADQNMLSVLLLHGALDKPLGELVLQSYGGTLASILAEGSGELGG